jgi:hypothetical protein
LGLLKVLDGVRQLVSDGENDNGGNNASSRLPALNDLIPRCRAELESLKGILEKTLRRKGRMRALTWPLKEADVNKTVENLGKFQQLLMATLSVDQTCVYFCYFSIQSDVLCSRLTLEIHTGVEALQDQSAEISQSIKLAESRIAGATQEIKTDVQFLQRQNAQMSQAMEQAKLRMSRIASAVPPKVGPRF